MFESDVKWAKYRLNDGFPDKNDKKMAKYTFEKYKEWRRGWSDGNKYYKRMIEYSAKRVCEGYDHELSLTLCHQWRTMQRGYRKHKVIADAAYIRWMQ